MARKGDLAVVELRHSSTGNAAGYVERTTFGVGRVASCDKYGRVKAWTDHYGCTHKADGYDVVRILTECPENVDISAVLADARAHHWPGHPSQPMPFDALAEVMAIALPHKIARSAGK